LSRRKELEGGDFIAFEQLLNDLKKVDAGRSMVQESQSVSLVAFSGLHGWRRLQGGDLKLGNAFRLA